ncbi:glycine betaine ABC transporter substrate-binding protein [Haloarchaeobius iranensis]|uniref:Osmoprotectant transport system substrate-binding protein n=1 Tax=Haloarchaeobius iranensis TaxID=996166 RepID=A0A1G9U1C5_9EURY|nr:glycine betaine ABC transporter substrate-binding protein [Haloarchaeobius iranensis]SDM53651.1 osmoprotectant transport system substrate-binding protein [Haloarchaeobius iranensis]
MTRRMGRRDFLSTACGGATGVLGGCLSSDAGDGPAPGRELRLGSKLFAENQLFAWLGFESLQSRTDVQPVHRLGIGQFGENWRALRRGEIDCYWEYTGTLRNFVDIAPSREFDSATALYEAAAAAVASETDIRVQEPAPLDNRYVLLARPDWAERTGVETISGLLDRLMEQPDSADVAFGPGFRTRPDGWNALLHHYGLDTAERNSIGRATTEVDPLLVYDHLRAGLFDIGVGYATSPQLERWTFTRLEDDRDFFTFYEPVALLRGEHADAEAVPESLDAATRSMDSVETVRRLAARIVFDGEAPRTVARDYLRQSEGG